MSIILNSINKLFIIIALIFAPNAHAMDSCSKSESTSHSDVLQKIHNIVETRLTSGPQITTIDALVPTLESLKTEALAAIAAHEHKTSELEQLEAAFKKLNPKSIADILNATAKIIKLVDSKTSALILSQLPPSIRVMVIAKSKC